jgi:SAM-dependent methyltransferase
VVEPSHLDAYRVAIAEHGPGFSATLWGSPETQALRFKVLHALIGGFGGTSVLDLGCGDAALARWMDQRGDRPDAYLGLDAMASQIEHGCETLPEWAMARVADIVSGGPLPIGFDWVVISGTLNTMPDRDTRHVIASAWESCTIGLAFNVLAERPALKWRDRDLGPARRHDVRELLAWAMERTPLVQCRRDYLEGHDATIVMRRS